MANTRKKISELTALTSASLDTVIVGVDNGTTYKIELDVLADAVTSRVNILDRDRLNSLESVTSSFENKGRNVISSSAQISNLGFVSTSVDISSLNSFTSSQNVLNVAYTNGINARLQTSSFNEFSASVHSQILAATNEQSLSHLATTGSNRFVGNQKITGSVSILIPGGTASGMNENPTSNNVFWSYPPQDTNTTNIQIGWTAAVEGGGTYTVTNIQYDTPFAPFIAITLSDPSLALTYRSRINFSKSSKLWEFNSNGTLTGLPDGLISGSQQISDLGFISNSADIADFTFSEQTISNSNITLDATNDITLHTGNGDIILNPDGNVYISSRNAGNGIVTDGYLAGIIGDTNTINNSTGHTITDNLTNIINSIPTISAGTISGSSQITELGFISSSQTGSFATTASNTFNGNQTINGSLTLNISTGIPTGVTNWVGQGGWNQGFYSNISTTGGTGTGLTVDVAAGGGGYITIGQITINNPGSGYTNGDVITIDNENNLPGTFELEVAATNLEFSSSSVQLHDLILNGTGSFQSDLTVYGNLKVWGTQSIINSTNVELSDNIIYLAPSGGGDFDLGIVGHYNDGTYSHTGIFSDASDGHAWKVFKGLSAETTGAFIDTNGVGFTLADFKANNIYGGIYATNGIISGSSQLTASFDTRYALSGSGGSTTIPVGTISGSSQLTASFDARYLNTGGDGVISGSSQITSFGFVSGSYETTGRGIISSSTNLVTTSSFNSYTASISTASLVTSITNLNTFSSSTNIKFSTLGNLTGSFATTGSNVFVGTETISGSLILSSSVPTSTTGGAGDRAGQIAIDGNYIYYNTTTYVPEVAYTYTTISGSGANPSWTNQLYGATTLWIAYWGSFTGSAPVPTAGLTLSDGTNTRVITSVTSNATGFGPSYILNFASSINWSTLPTITAISQSAINANWVKVPFNAITASTMVAGTISGSSQLTSSFDTRYTLSGSVQPLPSGLISGSSQLTASLDTRYAASGSVGGATPAGTISGSSQLTSSFDGRYLVTGSVTSSINQLNIFTASVSTASLVTSITNLNSTTASLLIETSNLETFSSSILSRFTTLSSYTASVNQTTASLNTFTSSINVWTSSIATTGSNSFNGAQTITGSLTVSSVAVVSASVTLPSGSILSLTSGSNLVIQNNGIAEITGSLKVSGSTILTGSITISSGSITMPDRPAFRVVGAGGTKAATTVISGSYMVADFSQGSGWNQSTGTFTAPIAGLYQVNIVARCAGNSNPSAQVIVYKNNTTTSPSPDGTAQIMLEWAANTTANHIGGSTITKLAVGDTLKAVVALGTISFDANDNFSVAYIG